MNLNVSWTWPTLQSNCPLDRCGCYLGEISFCCAEVKSLLLSAPWFLGLSSHSGTLCVFKPLPSMTGMSKVRPGGQTCSKYWQTKNYFTFPQKVAVALWPRCYHQNHRVEYALDTVLNLDIYSEHFIGINMYCFKDIVHDFTWSSVIFGESSKWFW